jgi:hypothetical protein
MHDSLPWFWNSAGVQFLCSTGLIKVGNSRNSASTVVVKAEWDHFIEEQQLSDFIEPINQTSSSKKCHYFVHFGEKAGLNHQPIDQMKGNAMRPKGKFLVESQWKFQKQLQEVLLVMRNQEEILVVTKHEASERNYLTS